MERTPVHGKQRIVLFLKGIAMGAADVVPGVSGGTVAFITGIYGRLLLALNSFNISALSLLFKGSFKQFWQHVDGNFLLTLLVGILTSILSLAKLVTWTLAQYPEPLWSFFAGLILASSLFVLREVNKWGFTERLLVLIGVLAAYLISAAVPVEIEKSHWMIFLSGAFAICAMILPGVSGSFILLVLGMYAFVLEALHTFNLEVIVVFVAGCGIGLLSFSRLLSYWLDKYTDQTLAVLTGFLLGALYKVWPWKMTIVYRIGSDGSQMPLVQNNVMPMAYADLTGRSPELLICGLAFLVGIALVWLLGRKPADSEQLHAQ
jgi:putative membrane protein